MPRLTKAQDEFPRYRCHALPQEHRELLARYLWISERPEDRWLWRMLDYLVFGTFTDERSGSLVLPESTMAQILGVCDVRSVAASVEEFYERTRVRVTLQPWHWQEGRARVIECVTWPREVRFLVDEIRAGGSGSLVITDTGTKITDKILRDRRHDIREEVEIENERARFPNPYAVKLVRYLNGDHGKHQWNRVRDVLDNARAVLKEAAGENEMALTYGLNLLRAAELSPQPFYKIRPTSQRVYTSGASILGSCREVRSFIGSRLGWHGLDLRSAQLAIIAREWEVPELQDFLARGVSFWERIHEHMLEVGDLWPEDLSEGKPALKEALYALAFGAESWRLGEVFRDRNYSGEESRLLREHWKREPLVKALLGARTRRLGEIKEAGGGVDVFGREYRLVGAKEAPDGKIFVREEDDEDIVYTSKAKAISASCCQAWEMKLLAPVINELEILPPQMKLVYWLHDGFAISCPQSYEGRLRMLKDKVDSECKRLGIPTELEIGSDPQGDHHVEHLHAPQPTMIRGIHNEIAVAA